MTNNTTIQHQHSMISLGNRLLMAAFIMLVCFFLMPSMALAQDAIGDVLNGLSGDAPATDGSFAQNIIQIFLLITILSLAPGIAMMITCLPFMLVVLSVLRQAIGLQQAPPTMMIISLAIFLTYFVMEPVFADAWQSGVSPFLDGSLTQSQAFERTMDPFRTFMDARIKPSTLMALGDALPDRAAPQDGSAPLSLMVPAFMISEIERGFEIGFVIFLPFLIIDLLVASVLMAMGMMMVPPVVVSLPFKLAFIVLADGWTEIASALVRGYAT